MKAKALLECLRVELVLLHRRLWVYLLFLLALSYFAYQSYDRVDMPGQIVNYTAYQVQSGIFLFLIGGVLLAREEARIDSEEVFLAMRGGLVAKLAAKFLIIVFTSFFFTASAYAVVVILFTMFDIPMAFYIPSLQYLVLYWFIPFVITGTLGLALGVLIRSKWVFPLAMLLGILFGPLNSTAYVAVTKSLPRFLEQTMLMMNLGQSDPFRIYHLVYGFQMESFRWVTKGALLLSSLVLLAASILIRLHKFRKWQVSVGTLVILVLVNWYSWQVFAPFVPTLSSRTAIREDNHYYSELEKKPLLQAQPFEVTRYEMDLKLEDKLYNRVNLSLTSPEALKSLVFTLYHGLKIESVRMKDQELSFTQDGDHFVVQLGQTQPANDPVELTIAYAGNPPLRFFATQEAVMLPNFVVWYPIAGAHLVADYDNMVRYYPLQPPNKTEFVMHYEGPTPLYTNLKKQADGTWTGSSSTGLVMMAGEIEKVQVGQQELIRPYALYNLSPNLQSDITAMLALNDKIGHLLGGPKRSIKQIYLMETRLNFPLIWLGEDFLIMDVDSYSNYGTAFALTDLNVEKLISANVRTENWEGQDERLKQLFSHSFAHALIKHEKLNGRERTYFASMGDSFRGPEQQAIYAQLLNFLDTQSWDKIHSFYQAWQRKMQAPTKMDWNALQTLLNQYE
jgi:hypothetical protein